MLVGATATEYSKQFVLLGAFIIGVVVPDGPPLGSALVDKFDSLISGILQPFFNTTTVMRIDFGALTGNNTVPLPLYNIILIFAAFLSKVAICMACGLFSNMAISDALALGFIMCAKGIVDLGAYTLFKE
ncbi:hypothetical protein Droror1_Dr00004367 [Drosera rotundifolia]